MVLRLAQLQLSHDSEYVDAIRKQSLRPIREPAVRGRIESSDGQILVDNRVSYDLLFFLPEFKLKSAGGISRTSEYMKDVLDTLAKIFELESKISSSEIASMLQKNSTARKTLMEDISDKHFQELEGRVLPPFIILEDRKLILDYSKVELLEELNGIDRTTENICREIDRICNLIGRPMKDNRDEVKRHIYQKPALPYKALEDLNVRERALIVEMLPLLNGTTIVANTKRSYPYKMEYSHILGSTRFRDPLKESEEERGNFHYYLPSLEGISGMERYVNEELSGVAGRRVVQVNIAGFVKEFDLGKHSVIRDEDLKKYNYDPINGNNVVLTLDHSAQKLAYDLLMNIPRETLGTPLLEGQESRAAFVLMDCNTGAIKAMVSTPSFDMHKFTIGDPEYFSEIYGKIDPVVNAEMKEIRKRYYAAQKEGDRIKLAEIQKELNKKSRKLRIHPEKNIPYALRKEPLINRALSSYEPGSIVKPLIGLAILKHKVFEHDYTMECDGFYELPTGKKIRCAARYGHGELNLEGAIEQSCNKFFITAGVELGRDKLREIFQPAGIARYPLSLNSAKRFTQERRGELFEKPPLVMADTAYASIGQGKITLSPLQAAIFVAAIANGGKVLKPYMVKEIRDSNSEVILEARGQTKVVNKLPVNIAYIKQMQNAMRKVVVGEYASATNAQVQIEGSLELAGKTGTAEVRYVPKDENGNSIVLEPAVYKEENGQRILVKAAVYKYEKLKNTWFTAYAPYDKPKYVAICFVQGGIYGGTTCAPIVRKFFDTWKVTKPKEKSE